MFYQDPIFPLIMAFITLIVVILHSIQNEKLIIKTMALAVFNLILAVVVYFTFDTLIETTEILKDNYGFYVIFVYALFLVLFIFTFVNAIYKANHYHLFVKSIRDSNWNAYYIVDRRERIKDMSESLLKELNVDKSDIIGKKLFSVFNKTIRFSKINDTEIDNKSLENYYKEYKKMAQVGDSDIQEIVFNNFEGREVVLKVVLQPVYVMGRYMGRMIVGEIKTDFDLLGVEKKLSSSNQELESIKEKFIATLKISKEGLFSIDLDHKMLWASDSLVKLLDLPGPEIDLSDFRKLIDPSDLNKYLETISNLSIANDQYYVRYRILKGDKFLWVEERGTRIFADKYTSTIMGSINAVSVKHFRASNIDVLDQIEDSDHLMAKLTKLLSEKKYFYLMVFELANIPKINEDHGWALGNMIIADYITKINNSFITENGGIYRITGLKFAAVLTDPSKLGVIKKEANLRQTYLNYQVEYGSIKLELDVYAGVAISSEDGVLEEHVYGAAEEALKMAKNPQVTHQVIFYKDITKNGH